MTDAEENSFRALTDQTYNLIALSEEASRLLPLHIPDKPGSESDPTSKKASITPRLIRHYQGLGCIDPPAKDGRNAVYNYRHLLQVLLVRKLQGEGFPSANIQEVLKEKETRYYEDLLQGGATMTLAPSHPVPVNAMNYLESLRARDGKSAIGIEPQVSPSTVPPPKVNRWTRIEVLPGLEVHVHDNFRAPNSKQEDENILKCIYDTVFRHFHNAPKS